ncbi:protein kinase [Myxococcota bacterium]|nr:protein kinase [Myxococcota bacterium]
MSEQTSGGESGVEFGGYRLIEVLGEGGMARVYRAEKAGPMGFRKAVAIKQILPAVAQEEKLMQALINEARLGGFLHHRNVVEVYEFGQVGDTWYIAMEFVDGWTLDRILRRCRDGVLLPPRIVLQIATQLCTGLGYAHTAADADGRPLNLVHRDLKPSNVIVTRDGVVKIMDFGIARAESNVFRTQTANVTKGTPVYMSPEQVTGESLDARSDLFSLASVLCEVATGEISFQGTQVYQVMSKVAAADVRTQVARADARIPGIGPVLARAYQKRPGDRYASALEMGQALADVYDATPGNEQLGPFLAGWMRGEASKGASRQGSGAPNLAVAADPASSPTLSPRGAGPGAPLPSPTIAPPDTGTQAFFAEPPPAAPPLLDPPDREDAPRAAAEPARSAAARTRSPADPPVRTPPPVAGPVPPPLGGRGPGAVAPPPTSLPAVDGRPSRSAGGATLLLVGLVLGCLAVGVAAAGWVGWRWYSGSRPGLAVVLDPDDGEAAPPPRRERKVARPAPRSADGDPSPKVTGDEVPTPAPTPDPKSGVSSAPKSGGLPPDPVDEGVRDQPVPASVLADLRHPTQGKRMAAVRQLARLRGRGALEELVRVLEHDKSWEVQRECVIAARSRIRKFGDGGEMALVESVVRGSHYHPGVRGEAVGVLRQLGVGRAGAVRAIQKALEDPDVASKLRQELQEALLAVER